MSSYQQNIDYKAVKDSGVEGVILRCALTYWGKQNKEIDACFEKHYEGFQRVGMPMGVYYYSCADSLAEAEAEAEKTLEVLKGKTFYYPVYFDVENDERQGKLDKAALTAITVRFCNILQKAGYFPGVYASTSWFQTKLNHGLLADKYTIWLADYRLFPNKSLQRDMHQYTGKGKIAGIAGNCDVNECYRDFPGIIKAAAPVKYAVDIYSFVLKTDAQAVADFLAARKLYSEVKPNGEEWRVYSYSYPDKARAVAIVGALKVFGIYAEVKEISAVAAN